MNKNVLVVVDMQKDFIDGALGTKEAVVIVSNVEEKIRTFDGEVVFTRDTHFDNYSETQEGKIFRYHTVSRKQKDGRLMESWNS